MNKLQFPLHAQIYKSARTVSSKVSSLNRFSSISTIPSMSFFFQAEDGIRDSSVTGVQTCALPISRSQTAKCRTLKLQVSGTEAHPVEYVERLRAEIQFRLFAE